MSDMRAWRKRRRRVVLGIPALCPGGSLVDTVKKIMEG